MRTTPFVLVGLVACVDPPSQEGLVVHGITGEPVGGFKLVAKATSAEPAMSCLAREADVALDGTFRLEELCPEVSYALLPEHDEWWLADIEALPPGGQAEPLSIVAWPAPGGSGLHVLSDGSLAPVKTTAPLVTDVLLGSEQQVRYPGHKAAPATPIRTSDHLLLVGIEAIEQTEILPLVPSGPKVFGGDQRVRVEATEYIGVEFESNSRVSELRAELEPSAVIDKRRGSRAVRYVRGDALPPGRYAAQGLGEARVYLLRFGDEEIDPSVALEEAVAATPRPATPTPDPEAPPEDRIAPFLGKDPQQGNGR